MSNNQLIDISKVYLEQIAETDQTEAYTVTAADKKGNTPAWKAYQKGKKNVKTGEPLYKAADHLKSEDKDWGYDKKGQSLNPADIEKRKRKEDKLFGSPKVKKEGYQRDPDRQEKDRKTSKQTDPSKPGFTGISDSIEEIMRQNAAIKKADEAKKKAKKK